MQTIISTQKEPVKILPAKVQAPVTASWILFFLLLIISIIYFFLSQPELPLLYSVATKQDQLVPKIFLFIFPIISLLINILHFFIAKSLKNFSMILLELFVGTTIGLQLLLAFALIRIIIITI